MWWSPFLPKVMRKKCQVLEVFFSNSSEMMTSQTRSTQMKPHLGSCQVITNKDQHFAEPGQCYEGPSRFGIERRTWQEILRLTWDWQKIWATPPKTNIEPRVDVSPFPFGGIFQVPFAALRDVSLNRLHLAWCCMWLQQLQWKTPKMDGENNGLLKWNDLGGKPTIWTNNPWQIEALTRRDSDRPGCFGDCEAFLGLSEQCSFQPG